MHTKNRHTALKLLLGCFIVLVAGVAVASPCTEKPGIDDWTRTYISGLHARSKVLAEICQCIQAMPDTRLHFDNIANLGLKISGMSSDASLQQREGFARFNADLLWVLANSGFALSQHNLATLHNAESGTIAQTAIRQDQLIFIFWTRKAAAQGEPRALFNLSMRLSRGVPAIAFAQDPALAYQLLFYLTKINSELGGALGSMMPAVLQEMQKLSVGPGRTQVLAVEKNDIDFAELAPKTPLPGSVWDSAANVDESVSRYYNMQKASGNEAAWAWSQKCYAEVLGLRAYSREHETCIAFDIANTQLTGAFFKRLGDTPQKNMPTQYGRDVFTARILTALMQTGMTMSSAGAQLDQINKDVGAASQKAAEEIMKRRQ